MRSWPGILATVAQHAGDAATQRLVERRGGTKMKLSASVRGPLAKLVGVEPARAIVADLGFGPYIIPMGSVRGPAGRRAAAAKLMAGGANAQEAALACDIHERTARRVRTNLKRSPGPLFGDD